MANDDLIDAILIRMTQNPSHLNACLVHTLSPSPELSAMISHSARANPRQPRAIVRLTEKTKSPSRAVTM